MSLLLEALKKAEKAKEDAQRRARDGEGEGGELRLEGEPAAASAEQKHVTRAELPQITAPLEILSEDIRSEPPAPAARDLSLQERPAAPPSAAPRSGADPQAAQRAAARKVFEAKVREPNPRLPFQITMGALGAFALGVVIYFWIQLRPPAPLVNSNPVKPSGEVQVATAPAPSATQALPAAPAQPVIQGLPSAVKPPVRAAEPAAPVRPAAAPTRSATPAIPRDPPPPRLRPAAPAQPRAAEAPVVAARPTLVQVHPRVEAGYAAYQAGRMEAARGEYQQALREEPGNRDALLGLAAVEMQARRYEAADALYRRVLQIDPRDAHAHAGMMALRSQQLDPVAAESRLKTLLAADPGADALHFALGNQFAQQGLWAEAQQAYAQAAGGDPGNPDYAYNLAVSLEHLRQPAPALAQYRRALALAQQRTASFEPATAQARVQQLAR